MIKWLINTSLLCLSALILALIVLLLVAYTILIERKILASIQRRRGPNYVGFMGLLQPIADAVKLIIKETIIPMSSNRLIFLIAPILALILSLLNWSILPLYETWVFADIQVSILMFFAVSSLTVYGIIMSGWASNSKYAFLGSLRAAAQVIAYEVTIGLTLVYIIIQTNSLNYHEIIWSQKFIWNVIPSFIFFFLFFIACLAETNRPPFDLPEAEAELVSGYNVEYSAMTFGYFFLSEYVSIWTVSILNVIIFWGGFYFILDYKSLLFYSLKIIIIVMVFVWVRGSVPRYRYDQLMRLGWKVLLPISLGTMLLYTGIYFYWLFKDLDKEDLTTSWAYLVNVTLFDIKTYVDIKKNINNDIKFEKLSFEKEKDKNIIFSEIFYKKNFFKNKYSLEPYIQEFIREYVRDRLECLRLEKIQNILKCEVLRKSKVVTIKIKYMLSDTFLSSAHKKVISDVIRIYQEDLNKLFLAKEKYLSELDEYKHQIEVFEKVLARIEKVLEDVTKVYELGKSKSMFVKFEESGSEGSVESIQYQNDSKIKDKK